MAINLIRAGIIYVFITVAVRLMGKRQIGELKPQELIITMLLGAAAAIPLEDNAMPLTNVLIPIMLFVALELLSAIVSMKSIRYRNLIQGRPIFIIRRGKLDCAKLRELRLSVDDIVDALRQKDIFDISEVEDAVLESNGTLSVLPKAEYRPLTPKDAGIAVREGGMPITVVMDGRPVSEYFKQERILKSEIELLVKGSSIDIKDIMLMTVDDCGNTYIIRRNGG
jgi:uncharacterized membrane protein YcaP (DUF421 family)